MAEDEAILFTRKEKAAAKGGGGDEALSFTTKGEGRQGPIIYYKGGSGDEALFFTRKEKALGTTP